MYLSIDKGLGRGFVDVHADANPFYIGINVLCGFIYRH